MALHAFLCRLTFCALPLQDLVLMAVRGLRQSCLQLFIVRAPTHSLRTPFAALSPSRCRTWCWWRCWGCRTPCGPRCRTPWSSATERVGAGCRAGLGDSHGGGVRVARGVAWAEARGLRPGTAQLHTLSTSIRGNEKGTGARPAYATKAVIVTLRLARLSFYRTPFCRTAVLQVLRCA